jgi:prefoldin subunit 5
MKKRAVLIACVALVMAACTNPKLEKIEQLKTEAIAVHDEVMPRMGEIHDLQVKLKALRKDYASDTTLMAQEVDAQLRDQVDALEIANEAMMDWMADYVVDFEKSAPEDSAVVYYTKQISAIEDVKLKMNESIEDAEKYLETFQD